MTTPNRQESGEDSSALIFTSGLRKAYGEMVALEELNLKVNFGECVALIGHNGSGKTTALKLAAGRLEPTAGEVHVLGEDVGGEADSRASRREIAYVSDEPVLYDDLTVAEHLELVGLAHGTTKELDERVGELLEKFGLGTYGGFLPGQLSRGLKQKTQLACAFIRPFSVIMLDEPVVGLDPRSQAVLREVLLDARANGAGVLLATHQLAFARGLADRAVILEEGWLVSDGAYEEVIAGEEALRLGLS